MESITRVGAQGLQVHFWVEHFVIQSSQSSTDSKSWESDSPEVGLKKKNDWRVGVGEASLLMYQSYRLVLEEGE